MNDELVQFSLSMAANAVQAFAILYLAFCPTSHKAFRWWGAAFVVSLIRKLVLPIEILYPNHTEWLGIWLIFLVALIAWAAAKMLFDQPVLRKNLIVLSFLALAWGLLAQFGIGDIFVLELPLSLASGGIIISAGLVFLRNRPFLSMNGHILAFVSFTLMGLHIMIYPWRNLWDWFPPLAYMISTIISMMIAFAIVIVASRREAAASAALMERLTESEAAYREMLDNLPDGVYRVSLDGKILRVNTALAKIMGYDDVADYMQAIQNQDTASIYVEAGRRQEFRKLATKTLLVEEFQSQVYKHRTQEIIWISETGRAVRDAKGEVVYFEGTIRDITQEKLNEEAKVLGEARLASIMEHAPFGLFLKAPDGTYLAANPASHIGSNAPDIIGKKDEDLLPENEVHWIKMEEERVLKTGQPVYSERAAMDALNPHWSLVIRFPVRGLDGATIAIGGFEIDVTKQKLTELELIAARDQATSANKAKSAFLANMSHELRTPLNAVIGFAEVLSGERFGALNDRQKSYLNDIHQAGAHLLEVINDILDMSRIEAGKLEIVSEIVNPSEIVQACLHIVRDKILSNRQQLQLNGMANPPRLSVDRRAIKQVLINLLSNAVKFTPPGGWISLSMNYASGGEFLIVVSDTGIGIAPDAVQLVMEPFRQADPSIAKRYEGSGLGLPISKRLMEMHGGSLRVDSTLGKGTTVTVIIPKDRVLTSCKDEDDERYQQRLEEARSAAFL